MHIEESKIELTAGDIYDHLVEQVAIARTRMLMGDREGGSALLNAASQEYLRFRNALGGQLFLHTLEHEFLVAYSLLSGKVLPEEQAESEKTLNALRSWKGRTEQRTYTVLYEQGPTSWGAYVPDLEGCIATGKTRLEVERLIQEALEIHVRGMARSGEEIPEPTIFPGQVTIQVPIATTEDKIAA